MRLKELHIRGFGRLAGTFPLEAGSGRVGLLLEQNEAGKSTLAAAVLAALYGLESDRRRARNGLVEKEIYRPWSQRPYGLVLELEAGGEELRIERDLESESVRVLRGGEDVTDRYREGSRVAVGERLTGLSRQQFTLSAFVGQGDLVWTDPGGLSGALQRVADSQAGRSTAAAALAALESALAQYEGITVKGKGRVETEIKRCAQRIDEDQQTLDALEEERTLRGEGIARLAEREQQQRRNEERRRVLRLGRLLHEQRELDRRLQEDDVLAARVEDLLEEIGREESLLELGPERLHAVEGARREWEGRRKLAERAMDDADQAEARRREIQQRRDALGLSRRPTEDDQVQLHLVQERFRDARGLRDRLRAELEREIDQLATLGFREEEALELAGAFQDLREEDRLLLGDRTRYMMRLQEKRQAQEEQLAIYGQQRAEIARERRTRARIGLGVGALGLAVAALAALLRTGLPLPALLAVGGGLTLFGAVLFHRAGRHAWRRDEEALHMVQRAQVALGEVEQEEGGAQRAWEELARRLDLDAHHLEERYRRYRSVERHVDTLQRLHARREEVERDHAQAMAVLAERWTLFGDVPDPDRLEDRLAHLSEALELYREADAAAATANHLRREQDEARAHARQQELRVRELLGECGVSLDAEETLEQGFAKLEQRGEAARRIRQRRDRELPELRERRLDPVRRKEAEERRQLLSHEREALEAQIPGDSTIEALDAGAYDAALADLDGAERRAQQRGEEERAAVRAFLSRYELEAPRLRASLESHRAALRRAQEFQEAVTLARDTLERIARETHRSWAGALNEHGNEVLRALGSQVRDLRFDETLGLSMREGDKLLSGRDAQQQLSAGALDGVYLAARLAVSRFLSDGEEILPLVLDDPFANADDERLIDGLRLLLDAVAPGQQVLLMACQRSRYQWARQRLGHPASLVVLPVEDAERARAEGDPPR